MSRSGVDPRRGARFLALLAAMSPLFAAPSFATPRPPMRDGMPCVAEVCIGEDVRELDEISWEIAKNPTTGIPLAESPGSDDVLDRLDNVLEGADDSVRIIAPYWNLHRFDRVAIAALPGISALCVNVGVNERLIGSYVSDRGFLTEVSIEPDPETPDLRFVVTSIVQYVGGSRSPEELTAIGREFLERHDGLSRFATAQSPGGGWVARSPKGPHLQLLAPFGAYLHRTREHANSARCHGDADSEAEAVPALPHASDEEPDLEDRVGIQGPGNN